MIQTLDLAERLSKAFVGFWIGFLTTIALAVASCGFLFELVFNDGGSYPLPPALGLALTAGAVVVGRYVSIAFDKLDLKTLLQWTGSGVLPREQRASRTISGAASSAISPGLNKPV